ncbi:right-handed parallel beta-helix repeat-containing protein [Pseudonocardia sp. TRM90224]|uniref:right-handed parallel beta-helix repeat-containing protein n=1 Tax=Pseudonocardia sp. TRM90224 TaxID=2812678 RepID=UPI001E508465|nr:right-handed parallel beta-helix repeat-containing protein [Pseudonocardia sp. TRM90224]
MIATVLAVAATLVTLCTANGDSVVWQTGAVDGLGDGPAPDRRHFSTSEHAGKVPTAPMPHGRRVITEQAPTSGRTIKVAKDGSGDATSVQDAAEQAQAGDTVLISAGEYPEALAPPRDGSSGAYITFQAAPGAAVVLDGSGGESAGNGLVDLSGRSFIKLVGLSFKGSSTHGVYAEGASDIVIRDSEVDGSTNGGMVFLGSSNILIEHSEVHGSNSAGTSASHEAISFDGSDGFEVAYSVVSDNGEEGIDAKYDSRNGKIHDNTVKNNRGPNIYVDSANTVEVYNNLVVGTTEGSKAGISLAVEDLSDSRRTFGVKVYNNVVVNNAGGGIGFWTESSGSFEDIHIVNNTVANNSNGGLNIVSGDFGGKNLLRNNIFSGNDEDVAGGADGFTADHNLFSEGGIGSALINGVVRFVDTTADDLRLTPGSAGVDAGSTADAPQFDITGAKRPTDGKIDIGAYELSGDGAPTRTDIQAGADPPEVVVPQVPAPVAPAAPSPGEEGLSPASGSAQRAQSRS